VVIFARCSGRPIFAFDPKNETTKFPQIGPVSDGPLLAFVHKITCVDVLASKDSLTVAVPPNRQGRQRLSNFYGEVYNHVKCISLLHSRAYIEINDRSI
jgi:hypothetical protein